METRNQAANLESGGAVASSAVVRRMDLAEMLGEAMQDVWDDHVGDTNETPDCIQLHGPAGYSKVSGHFKGSLFAFTVARRVEWLMNLRLDQPCATGAAERR